MAQDAAAPSDPQSLPAPDRLVLFVCPHGAGKSRIAQAYFDVTAAAGWHAISAGTDPQSTVSEHAGRLLAGTPAEAALDVDLPRPVHAVAHPDVVVAIDCADPPVPGARGWKLRHQDFDTAMRDEIRDLVIALTHELGAAVPTERELDPGSGDPQGPPGHRQR